MEKKSFWLSSKGIAACLFVVIIIYMLLKEHTDHVFQYLPFAILLLCPLMHLFMHGGHGSHNDHSNHHEESAEEAYRRGLDEGRKTHDS